VKFREELPEELRLLLVVLFHFGTRLGELKALEWRQVDLEALEVRLDPGTTKTGQGRVAPIYGELKEWLKMAKQIRDQLHPDCPWSVPSRREADQELSQGVGRGAQARGDPARDAARSATHGGATDVLGRSAG
jgi:integrase